MKAKYLLLLILAHITVNSFAQNYFQKAFGKVHLSYSAFFPSISKLAVSHTGNVYAAGNILISPASFFVCNSFIIKLNQAGDTVWTKYSSITGGISDLGFDNNENIYAAFTDLQGKIMINKLDSSGNLIWSKSYGRDSCFQFASKILFDGISSFKIFGSILDQTMYPSRYSVYSFDIDTAGNLKATPEIISNLNNSDLSQCIGTDDLSGNTYFAAMDSSPYSAVAFGKKNRFGDIIWSKEFVDSSQISDIFFSKDSDIVIGGTVAGSHIFLTKIDTSGSILWFKLIGIDSIYFASHKIISTNDNGFVILASLGGYDVNFPQVFIKTDASGNVQWAKTIEDTLKSIRLVDVVQNSNGNFIISGSIALESDSTIFGFVFNADAQLQNICFVNDITVYDSAISGTPKSIYLNHTSSGTSGVDSINFTSGFNVIDLCSNVGFNEFHSQNQNFIVSPNPASNQLTIQSSSIKKHDIVYIYDALGQQVLPSLVWKGDVREVINISTLAQGIYFIQLAVKDERWTGKFIKE